MIEGISKERLKEYRSLRLDAEELLDRIIDECKELPDQQWKTIDEFMAEPIEGWCWVTYLESYNGKTEVDIAYFSGIYFYYNDNYDKNIYETYAPDTITHVQPIYKPEAYK